MSKESGSSASIHLKLLHDLANLLQDPADLHNTLNSALTLLANNLGMMRGAITMIAPENGLIRIEASYGLNRMQRSRGSYLPGEGITGRVVASGEPMYIADVGKEPLFLNRTRSRNPDREKISFLCVPIKFNGKVVGALSVDQLRAPDINFENELKLLEIIAALLANVAHSGQKRQNENTAGEDRPKGFVGSSEVMRQVYDQLLLVAPATTTVFLQGESGTGKELAARAIHNASSRANGPFISLNCAALPEGLVESELFGHERGAFTGATQTRRGRFELARGGTLFLDEIGELSPLVQAKLLRVLQERAFERVGGMETLRTDARVIAATNRDLAEAVKEGNFRRDLYYRLNVFPVYMPPLRERRDDILPLAAHFLERYASIAGKKSPLLSMAAMDVLQRYSWPGNIRELENVMERATLLAGRENIVLPHHLPAVMRPESDGSVENASEANIAAARQGGSLDARLAEVERGCLVEALEASHGRQNNAAGLLGITPRILGLRLKKYGLNPADFRNSSN